jgi:transcriptional regulator with XRE-family HTH domain
VIAERRAFGDRLRRQRQRKNLSLTEIAAITKVGASHFAALERGDCSRWPGGVYNRAFIRAYAQAIGLDPDETAAEFAECHEPPPAVAAADAAAGVAEKTPTPPALRIRIEPDPYESEKRVVRIVALVILDLMAVASLAAAGLLFTPASFWISLAAASIGYLVLSRIARSVPRAKKLPGHGRYPQVEPASDAAQELITDP